MKRSELVARILKRPKYGGEKAVGLDGFKYDSKKERDYGDKLVLAHQAGAVRLLLRQVPFHLPGGVKLVLDFLWVDELGRMHFEDVKAAPTAAKETFRAKVRMVEQLYDISVEVVW